MYSEKSATKQGVKWCCPVKSCNAKIFVDESSMLPPPQSGHHLSRYILTHFSPLYPFEYRLYNFSWSNFGFELIGNILVTVYSDILETAIMNDLPLPCFLCIQCNFKFSLDSCLILCFHFNNVFEFV
jgi:hypothetical protein